ncbi:hypothetical protein KR609_19635, partial [Acinetobacter baumannii]|nr:hypothetical protein [Acinetobacter baumannii]
MKFMAILYLKFKKKIRVLKRHYFFHNIKNPTPPHKYGHDQTTSEFWRWTRAKIWQNCRRGG